MIHQCFSEMIHNGFKKSKVFLNKKIKVVVHLLNMIIKNWAIKLSYKVVLHFQSNVRVSPVPYVNELNINRDIYPHAFHSHVDFFH